MDIEQFWAKLDKSQGVDGCWTWKRRDGRTETTYRQVTVDGRKDYAHRIALRLKLKRELRENALHRCDNPPCCNPAHLFEGTQADNAKDMLEKGRGIVGRKFPGCMPRGEAAGPSKLTEKQVLEIRKRYAKGESQRALGRAFGVYQHTIACIVHRKTWTHI